MKKWGVGRNREKERVLETERRGRETQVKEEEIGRERESKIRQQMG